MEVGGNPTATPEVPGDFSVGVGRLCTDTEEVGGRYETGPLFTTVDKHPDRQTDRQAERGVTLVTVRSFLLLLRKHPWFTTVVIVIRSPSVPLTLFKGGVFNYLTVKDVGNTNGNIGLLICGERERERASAHTRAQSTVNK